MLPVCDATKLLEGKQKIRQKNFRGWGKRMQSKSPRRKESLISLGKRRIFFAQDHSTSLGKYQKRFPSSADCAC